MRRFLLCLAFLLLATPASATLWYFSDCATGGTGTIGDPFCVDPDSDGINESMEVLFDGAGSEAAAKVSATRTAARCRGARV
jgi:hypothetical protein